MDDNLEIEYFDVDGGVGFKVGSVYQPHNPDKPDNTPMTAEEAREIAEAIRLRLL